MRKNMNIFQHRGDNRVSRKLLKRLILTSLLPILVFTIFIFYNIDHQNQLINSNELQDSSKTLNYTIDEKLQYLTMELRSFGHLVDHDGSAAGKSYQIDNPTASDWFKSIHIINDKAQATLAFGQAPSSLPLSLILKNLHNTVTTNPASFETDKDGNMYLSLQYTLKNKQPIILIAMIETHYIKSVFNTLPLGTQACIVQDKMQKILCSNASISRNFPNIIKTINYYVDEVESPLIMKDDYYYYQHTLSDINSKYNLNWSIALVKPNSWIVSVFLFYFPFVVLVSLLFTSMMMIRTVNKILRPLNQLTLSNKTLLTDGHTDGLMIQTNDEFEEIGNTLFHLSTRLGKHANTLATMSSIDKIVLHSAKLKKFSEAHNEQVFPVISTEQLIEVLFLRLKNIVSCDNFSAIINERHNIYTATHYHPVIQHENDTPNDEKVTGEPVKLSAMLLDILSESKSFTGFTHEELRDDFKTDFSAKYEYCIFVPVFIGKELSILMIFYFEQKPTIMAEEYQLAADIGHRIAVIINNVASEDKLYHKAHFDALTNLPNRVLFHERLYQSLQRANRNDTLVALLFVDLDAFKELNDTMGHSAGDEFLIEIAHRLETCTREVDTVARMGGDEFTIILPDLPDDNMVFNNVENVAQKILDAVATPYLICGKKVSVTVSIGIAIYPKDCDNVADLLKHADVAMYQAKNQGKMTYVFYAGGNRAAHAVNSANTTV